jgi:hypothetical protein
MMARVTVGITTANAYSTALTFDLSLCGGGLCVRSPIDTWWQRTLASDDIAGIQYIYGKK